MFQVIIWLMVVVSVFMVLVVLAQKAKGGGLNQSMAGTQQIMGVRKSTDFIEKATWVLAGTLLVFSFVSVAVMPSHDQSSSMHIGESLLNDAPVQQAPAFDAQAPAAEAQSDAQQTPAAD